MPDLSISVMSWPDGDCGTYALFRTRDGKWLFKGRGETTPITSGTGREWFREQERGDLLWRNTLAGRGRRKKESARAG